MVETTLKIRNKSNFSVPAPLPAYSAIDSIHDLSALQPITN